MKPIVFLGPTLPRSEAEKYLDAEYWPPAEQGSVHRALAQDPSCIGIVDGRFDTVPAVWHKEIMFAARTRRVYGAASLGALRAVELRHHWMTGIGVVYTWYRDGVIVDDDEVTVAHLSETDDYRPTSVAMVDIRVTVAEAVQGNIIGKAVAKDIVVRAKGMFYPDRVWPAILAGFKGPEIERFQQWWPHRQVSCKAQDAREMLLTMARDLNDQVPYQCPIAFEPTDHWEEAMEVDRGAA